MGKLITGGPPGCAGNPSHATGMPANGFHGLIALSRNRAPLLRLIKAGLYDNLGAGTARMELTIITTHINADFDAVASMLAAQKLYPDAKVVFPGSQEKNLRNFFVKSMAYLFNMIDVQDVDLDRVGRLVLVDTRQPHRIGRLADLLHREDLDIHIYDHHPNQANDIKGNVEVVQLTGATVTILAGIIAEKGIDIGPDEATIMCLGLYEDTGSFTFSSTTEKDFKAAGFLLSKGANLNTVSNLMSREISFEQVGLLNDMIQSATRYTISGIEVVVTVVTADKFVPDFAFLVHKMVKMENLEAIFAIAQMENKIYITARSRVDEVDAAAILDEFGGGGHSYAAAATVKGQTLTQVEHVLVDLLYKNIQSRRLARDLMSAPAISVSAGVSCREAAALLTRYNINALLVTQAPAGRENSRPPVGFITRQVIEKALFHQLDHVAVSEYMTSEPATVSPSATLSEIQEKIIENKQRVLPVVEKGTILGVITRTDLLNILVRRQARENGSAPDRLPHTVHARTRNVLKFMQERLPARIMGLLQEIGRVADETGDPAYVVGGFVRDLFLYRANEDLDVVIEGDGIAFAQKFARMTGARIHTHAKFGTAVVIFPDGFKLDVASARLEYYSFPAALPIVETSSIRLDLFRRDFTVNTLAIQLSAKRFGTLIDFFAAQKDIKEKTIRVLHNLSFVEDPTRVFRAIRFEQRFGFTIGKLTSSLIVNAVKMDFFRRLSGKRVFAELRQLLEEENPTPAMVRLHEYGLLPVIHPSIMLTKDMTASFTAVKKVLSWYDLLFLEESYMKWAVYFLAIIRTCDATVTGEICRRFELAPRHRKLFLTERFAAERCLVWLERHQPVKKSVLYRELSPFRTEVVLYMMALTDREDVKRVISQYITGLRYVQATIKGRDLIEMGLTPGPIFRDIFQAVMNAKLDGRLMSRNDEIQFVHRYLKRARASTGQDD
jgi:tRNA nucleotidyltransferase (CCA-adding enzyme)